MSALPLGLGDAQRLDDDRCYEALLGRERRFDGWFVIGVRTTGIYCRPSCPTPVHPLRKNVDFYRSTAAAQQAGLRACKRCRPDATPGSPEWNVREDLAARAVRLINDGVVDREGVPGLARRLHISTRQLQRLLNEHLGAGPVALARAQRAQTARVLIETTDMAFGEIAFAAGFSSIRQFNDTVGEVFAASPSSLRSGAPQRRSASTGVTLALRLPYRPPFDAAAIFAFLAARAVAGVEVAQTDSYSRVLRLPSGPGRVTVRAGIDHLAATFTLSSLSDLCPAVARIRHLFDLDADPLAIDAALSGDERLQPLAAKHRGRRAPGAVDADEIVVRAILGQQVSVAAARTQCTRLTALHGSRIELVDSDDSGTGLTHVFPTAQQVAEIDPATLPLPAKRAAALVNACSVLASGTVDLSVGADREQARAQLCDLPGIGPWTAGYISMRALGDPDVLLDGDLVAMNSARALGLATNPAELRKRSNAWAPWRSYATQLLWAASTDIS